MTITLEPMLALFNLGGIEIILIIFALLTTVVVVVVMIAAVIALVLRAMSKQGSPVPVPPAAPTPPLTQVIRRCPQCSAELRSDAPEGLCPACLLQRGIATEGGLQTGTPPFTPPPLAELAKLFPQLEILEVIGQGGMGAVYKARQPALDRVVALKILAPRSGGDLDFSGRFSREARALARLSHPNIVGVYDFGQIQRDTPADSSPSTLGPQPLSYFIMEFVDGPNLRQVEQAGKLTPREALQIIPQICAALQFAHDEGIVHRDIKPENVLLDKKGRVKIADFGLAKILGQEADFRLTGARDVMGTPHYMAPEQVEKPQEVDHRADIYSLGVVFYEMLTGDLPIGKFDPPSHKVQIDVRLDEVVLRSLANNPDRRYQQVSELRTEVETITTTPPAPASASSQAALRGADAPRPRAKSIVLTVINIISAVLLLVVGWTAVRLGMFFNTVFFFILLAVPIRAAVLLWRGFQDGLEYGLWKKPLAHEFSKHRWQMANRWIFWLLCAAVLEICMVPQQFGASAYAVMRALYLGGTVVLLLLELMPARRLRLATNIALAIGSLFMATQIIRIYTPEQKTNGVVLSMPVRGEWLILHGGRSSLINNHYFIRELRNALDIEKLVDGQERTNKRDQLESYPSWGQTVYAPADGKIAVVANDFDDHEVNKNDYENILGNHICLDIGENRFVLLANLQKGSVLVSTGAVVHAGQPLAKCGNSGSSSHPHLHIQVQDAPQIFVSGQPEAKTFPIEFRDATRLRAGNRVAGAPFFVRRNDWIVSDAEEDKVIAPEKTNLPASAETWSPDLAPGEKPDLAKILEDAKYQMTRGHFEESLGRYIWFYNHEPEYGDSYQNTVRTTSAISAWVELGRRYPKAKQALIEIRDRETREFAQGRGYLDLFQTVQAINRELQDNEPTYTLYQAILKGDPQLARQCYFWMETTLVAKGEYELCFEDMGNPQSRFSSAARMFQMDLAREKQSAEMQERSRQQLAEMYRQRGQTNMLPFSYATDTSAMMSRDATNRFVGVVGMLVEILVGTGHQAEAEGIRDQALKVLDDPRLTSVMSDAEARVQQKRKSNLEKPASSTNSIPANFTVPSPAKVTAGITNTSEASAETWAPALNPGEQPDLMKIMEETKDLISKGHYDQALPQMIWYHNHSLADPSNAGVRVSFVSADWLELGRHYPKAMRALIETRNEDQRKLLSGEGSTALYVELKTMNEQLGDEDRTYALFKKLIVQDTSAAHRFYPVVEELLAKRGDYQLCFDYMGSPETRFKKFQNQWRSLKQFETRQDATNGTAAFPTLYEPPAPPKFADQHFIDQTRLLIEILVGTNHKEEAEKIRDEAATLIDDARIKSAVSDAEEKIQKAKS